MGKDSSSLMNHSKQTIRMVVCFCTAFLFSYSIAVHFLHLYSRSASEKILLLLLLPITSLPLLSKVAGGTMVAPADRIAGIPVLFHAGEDREKTTIQRTEPCPSCFHLFVDSPLVFRDLFLFLLRTGPLFDFSSTTNHQYLRGYRG